MFTSNVVTKPRPGNLLKMKGAGAGEDKIDATAADFESQFIAQMVGTMFSTVEEDSVTGGGSGEEMYKSFLTQEYGKIMTRAGGVGVSAQVKRELLRLQEAENGQHANPAEVK